MDLVFRSALDALDDLRAPGMVKLFFACVGLTILASLLIMGIGIGLVDTLLIPRLPSAEEVPYGFLASLINFFVWTAAISAFIVPMFIIFWSLMIFIASFFDEYIAEKIESFRYPKLAIGKAYPFWSEFRQDIYFAIKLFLLNLVVLLPLIVIPLFWPLLPIVFPLLNGYMLGRYFFTMAGGRHIGRKAAHDLASKHRWKITLAGLLIVFASGVPFLNLLVPFWGVAMMVHLYHLIDNPQIVEILPAA